MMIIITWNVREMCTGEKRRAIRRLIKSEIPDIFFAGNKIKKFFLEFA